MKKNVLVFGAVAGLIVTAWMVVMVSYCYKNPNSEAHMWMGYGSMLVAFSFIFVGIKNYRDKYNNGMITFGKAFQIGLFISLIASTMYVLTWLVVYYCFIPDFMDRYVANAITQAKASGVSAAELANKKAEMATYTAMYKNPVMIIVLTYVEVLPVGLVVALIAAAILKRKPGNEQVVPVGQ